MIYKNVFKTFFNVYDTSGNYHDGFIQNMDFSAYVDLTMLNDLSKTILDSFIYNEFSSRIVLSRWKNYMTYNPSLKRYEIDPRFYSNAVIALYVYLAKKEKFFNILTSDFRSLSANETETINYGQKATARNYGATLKTNVFDRVVVELSKGTETENRGTHTDTLNNGAHTDTERLGMYTNGETIGARSDSETIGSRSDSQTIGSRSDSETIGARSDSQTIGARSDGETIGSRTDSETRTEKDFPFDAVAFVNKGQTEVSKTQGAQTNSSSIGQQSNSSSIGAQNNSSSIGQQNNSSSIGAQNNSSSIGQQENTLTFGARVNTEEYGAQSNSTIYGAQENTRSYGKTTNETLGRTDTEAGASHSDSETVSARIDTKTRTKVILIDPEKYFEIQKELSEKNLYTLFSEAVNECFLNDCFEFQALENGGVII